MLAASEEAVIDPQFTAMAMITKPPTINSTSLLEMRMVSRSDDAAKASARGKNSKAMVDMTESIRPRAAVQDCQSGLKK